MGAQWWASEGQGSMKITQPVIALESVGNIPTLSHIKYMPAETPLSFLDLMQMKKEIWGHRCEKEWNIRQGD